MYIRDCRDDDLVRCAEIWRDAFPEDSDFCDYYFKAVHPLSRSLVCEAEGDLTSYLALIPFEANVLGKTQKCSYVYAVSTDTKYRKKGYMAALLNHALEITKDDAFVFLIPSVKGVYEKFGFRKIAEKREITLNGGRGGVVSHDIEHFNYVYSEFCKNFDVSVKRSPDWWKIIYETALADGFGFIANEGAYAVVRGFEVLEIAYTEPKYLKNLSLQNGVLHLPQVMARGDVPFNNNYFSMLLD